MKKKFVTTVLAVTMFSGSCVYAGEMPENYWAAEDMERGEMYAYCTTDQYADYVTYEDGDLIFDDFYFENENGSYFDVINYTNGYITRAEWANAINELINNGTDYFQELVDELTPEEKSKLSKTVSPFDEETVVDYTDVIASDEYFEGIKNCKKYGIMQGYEDNSFKPESYITYAEAMTTISRLEDKTEDIMADNGYNLQEVIKTAGGGSAAGVFDFMTDMQETMTELTEKAKDGTLKSDKKLDANTEKAIDTYMETCEKMLEREGRVNMNGTMNIEVLSDGLIADMSMSMDIDGDVLYAEGEPSEMAIRVCTGISSEEESMDDMIAEVYMKDGYIYEKVGDEKIKIPYSDDKMPDMMNGSMGMFGSMSTTSMISNEESLVLSEYLYRETVTKGSVEELEDGKCNVEMELDLKEMLSLLGMDIDKLLELASEEGEVTVKFEPLKMNTVLSTEGDCVDNIMEFGITINDPENGSMEINMNGDVKYDYPDDKNIVFPDFSDYEDISEFYSDDEETDDISGDVVDSEDDLTEVLVSYDPENGSMEVNMNGDIKYDYPDDE